MATVQQAQPSQQQRSRSRWSILASGLGGLLAAPCAIGVLLIPLGAGTVMTSAAFKFFDDWRFLFMGLALALLVLSHIVSRRAHRKTPIALWILTVLVVAFIAGELYFDPPWDRHANIPEFT
jgi:cell division protein FtsW (lipid II flippase)